MSGEGPEIEAPEELEGLFTEGENRFKRWVLLTGGRITVMVALMSATFAFVILLGLVRPVDMENLLSETDAARELFTTLLSGAILLVSVVVSINSVVLSQEITDLEDQISQIDSSLEYHRKIEDYIASDVSPARPGEFLIAVLYGISKQLEILVDVVEGSTNDELKADVDVLADQIAVDVRRARWTLEDAERGTFEILLAGLNYDYSGQLNAIRGLKRKHGGDLTEEEADAIEEVLEVLKHVGTSREYFKSLYFKRELAYLSSRLLYVALPVIVFTSYVILALDARIFPNVAMYGLSSLYISISFAYVIALAPYLILTSYILRAATVAIRTLSAGPFILRTGDNIDSLDWEVEEPERDWGSVAGQEHIAEKLEEEEEE